MKKRLFPIFTIILLTAIHTSFGHAISIDFFPPSRSAVMGNPVDVTIRISDLGEFTGPSLSTFDLDVSFDPAILNINSVTYGDPVLGDQLDLFDLGSLTATTVEAGSLNLFQLSFDLPDDLNSLQPSAFALATVSFDTLEPGTSRLGLTTNALGDAAGEPLEADFVDGLVTVNPIPLPSTLILFVTGLAGLGSLARVSGNHARTLGDQ